jgi:glycosyltransferase involved in cell wall biosynthesis
VRRPIGAAFRLAVAVIGLPVLVVAAALPRRRTRTLVWGPEPLINYRYWSAALRASGWDSVTLVSGHYHISKREDFDVYHEDLLPRLPALARALLGPYAGCIYVLRRASVAHFSFGGVLRDTPVRRLEAWLYRLAGVRTVVIPFGGDMYMYSRIPNPVIRNALLTSYPELARREPEITERVDYWSRHADVIVVGFTVEGLSRWDVPVGNMICIDLEAWRPREYEAGADGRSRAVRVLHTPNHRGVKGTEFLLEAVDELRDEGLEIELVLVEGRTNEDVRQLMQEVDVLADQFILPGYGLAAIEGMASGLPVMCNLDADPATAQLFRMRSFLRDCPIVQTTPETVLERLRELVTQPGLRGNLGRAGREYAEAYHSYDTARYLFESIYARLLDGADVDLMNLFNPRTSVHPPRVRASI